MTTGVRFGVLAAFLGAVRALAQTGPCFSEWLPGEGSTGRSDTVTATAMWDPDGPGPRTPVVLVAAFGDIAGDLAVGRIGQLDLATRTWSPFPGSVDGRIECITPLDDGTLLVGGLFADADGVQASNIARWNGTGWEALGTGTSGVVRSIVAMPDGAVLAGGAFNRAGTTIVSGIASWNGSAWSRVGLGGVSGSVNAMRALPDGSLLVAGSFIRADRVANTANIARWDGSAWTPYGNGWPFEVTALDLTPSGASLIATSLEFYEGGVVRGDGTSWEVLAGNLNGRAWALLAESERSFYLTGEFVPRRSQEPGATCFGYWNGGWADDGMGFLGQGRRLLRLPDESVLVGGWFSNIGDTLAANLAQWSGGEVRTFGRGVSGPVLAITMLPDGRRVLAAATDEASGSPVHVLVESPSGWRRQGQAMQADPARDILALPDGSLMMCGRLSLPEAPGAAVLRWRGDTWEPMPGGPTGDGRELILDASGEVYLCGELNLAGRSGVGVCRWDGEAWSPVGDGVNYAVFDIAQSDTGEIMISGVFTRAGSADVNGVAVLDGDRWRSAGFDLQTWTDRVEAMPGGRFAVSYRTTGPNFEQRSVAIFDGAGWARLAGALEPAEHIGLLTSRDGRLYAYGWFNSAGGRPMSRVARWSGEAWAPVGGEIDSVVECAAETPEGDLMIGGYFSHANGSISRYWALARQEFAPAVVSGPEDVATCLRGQADFTVRTADAGHAAYRWEAADGRGGWMTVADGLVTTPSGAPVAHAEGATTPSLRLMLLPNIGGSEALRTVRCVVETACGATTSDPAAMTLCAADFNCDAFIDFFDYDDFVMCYERGECGANGSADFNLDGFEDFFDYADFVRAFEIGC